jgi:drug/metabolite transporter (DMT)-like permease
MLSRGGRFAGDAALLACAIGWGTTFPVTSRALDDASPLVLNALRFSVAALVLVRRGLYPSPRVLRPVLGWGAALGAMLAGAYALQTFSLTLIGPSRSAFLTAFYVLFTPLIDWLWLRRRPERRVVAGVPIALAGVAVMTGVSLGRPPGLGDVLTLLCAALFAAQIVALGEALGKHPARQILFLQIAFCGFGSALAAPLVETPRAELSSLPLLASVFFLAVVATVLLLGLQAFGQARTTATRAAVLFSSEPVWAALFSAAAGERLRLHEIAGAALVLAGILVATVRPARP